MPCGQQGGHQVEHGAAEEGNEEERGGEEHLEVERRIDVDKMFTTEHAMEDIAVTDGITCVYPLFGKDKVEVDATPYSGNAAVSLIPWNFNEPVTGVTTKGLYYALKDADLDAGSTFSFSNKPRKNADKISVSIKSGMLLVTVTNAI